MARSGAFLCSSGGLGQRGRLNVRALAPPCITSKCAHGRDYWCRVLRLDMQAVVGFSLNMGFMGVVAGAEW